MVGSISLAQLETALQAVDHASRQDVVWLLCALVVLLILAVFFMGKWHLGLHEKLSARVEEVQDRHTGYLERSNTELVQVVNNNSGAMREFSEAVGAVRHLFQQREQTKAGKHPASMAAL